MSQDQRESVEAMLRLLTLDAGGDLARAGRSAGAPRAGITRIQRRRLT
jgi:hypothetical protein